MIASATRIFAGPLITAVAFDLGAGVHAASEVGSDEPYPRDVVARALAFGLAVTVVSWTGVSLYLSTVLVGGAGGVAFTTGVIIAARASLAAGFIAVIVVLAAAVAALPALRARAALDAVPA